MKNLVKITAVLFVASLIMFLTLPSLAARTEKVPALQLTKTGNHRGQFAIAYYAYGRLPLVHIGVRQPIITQVRNVASVKVEGDSVDFPSLELEREGVRDYVVVVVLTPHSNFVWKNSDQTIPSPLKDSGVYQYSHVSYLSKETLDSHLSAKGENSTYVWPLF